jgi:hypothetical protein
MLRFAPQARFWGKCGAGNSKVILSARQHQPDDQNPIAKPKNQKNAAQAWYNVRASTPKRRHLEHHNDDVYANGKTPCAFPKPVAALRAARFVRLDLM